MNVKGDKNMKKPLTIVVREVQEEIANICNNSGLSPIILDLIFQNLTQEVHSLAEQQLAKEKFEYNKQMEVQNESE